MGFRASHEQFSPSKLLQLAMRAREAGFECLFCSDHFAPWSEEQGQSGYSFAWLGAVMQATGLPARTICCPAFRYHPAIVAQAAATLVVFAHRCKSDSHSTIAVFNFTPKPLGVTVDCSGIPGDFLQNMLRNGDHLPLAKDQCVIDLEAFGYRWLRVEERVATAKSHGKKGKK